jgi:hypothetical protein
MKKSTIRRAVLNSVLPWTNEGAEGDVDRFADYVTDVLMGDGDKKAHSFTINGTLFSIKITERRPSTTRGEIRHREPDLRTV